MSPASISPSQYDFDEADEREPRKDWGRGLDGRPITNEKSIAYREGRESTLYEIVAADERERELTERFVEAIRPAIREAVRDALIAQRKAEAEDED